MSSPTRPVQASLIEEKSIRVTVPVTPEVLEAFQALAAVSGMSTGRAMGEWLADTLDGVRSMNELLQKAKAAPRQAVRELNAYALGLADLSQELMDSVMKQSGAVSRQRDAQRPVAAGRTARTTVTPPSSNTGGKPTAKVAKRARKT
jgi:hypothetical protein